MMRFFTLSICVMLLVLLTLQPSYADNIHVPDDYNTIRAAINAAEDGDSILVAPGVYVDNIDFDGKNIVLVGNPDDPSETVIDGDAWDRVVLISSGETSDAELNGFTIRNGYTQGIGGGIYCNGSSPVLRNLIVTGNVGGGLCSSVEANPVVYNSSFVEHEGSGVSCYGGSNLTLDGVTITDNFTGVFCENSTINLVDVEVLHNAWRECGGGMTLVNSRAVLTRVTINENSNTQYYGGGMYIDNSHAELSEVILSDNSAAQYGGAVCIWSGSEVEFTDVIITNNTAGREGGGIYGTGTILNMTDVIISGNSAEGSGGGIYTPGNSEICMENVSVVSNTSGGSGGAVFFNETISTLTNVTMSNNSAADGGGGIFIFHGSTPVLTNCISFDNEPNEIEFSRDGDACSLTVSYCDVEGGEDGIRSRQQDEFIWGDGNIDADPLFVDPENGDFHLSWANCPEDDETKSPCIDAGDPESPPDPDGTRADMGAFYFEHEPNMGFTKHVVGENFDGPRDVMAIDFDYDGDMDILSSANNDGRITWWENDGEGGFDEHDIFAEREGAWNINAADMDEDGDMDVLSAYPTPRLKSWLENIGEGNFTEHIFTEDIRDCYEVIPVDLDKDGDWDILGAGARDVGMVLWWENDGEENFTERLIGYSNGGIDLQAVDFDADGDWDVVGAGFSSDEIALWENDGEQRFEKHLIAEEHDGANSVFAIDIDGDEDIDILSSAQNLDHVTWWENVGNRSFDEHVIIREYYCESIYAIDIDGDEDVDVITCNMDRNTVDWWENDGEHVFSRHCIDVEFLGAAKIFAMDVDRDGDNDVLGAGWEADEIAWWENNIREPVEVPDISLSPESIDFGAVQVGESAEEILTISNTGDAELTVSDISTEAPYSVAFEGDLPLSIEPDGCVEVAVTFAPEAVGEYQGVVSITSNDPDEEIVEVPLAGECPNRSPVVIGEIPDQELPQWFEPCPVAQLNHVFSDPDGDDLEFTAVSGNGNLIPIIDGDDLWLSVEGDWTGEADVTVTADDGHDPGQDRSSIRNIRSTCNEPRSAIFNPVAVEASIRSLRGLRSVIQETTLNDALPHRDDTAQLTFHVTVVPDNEPPWDVPEETGVEHTMNITAVTIRPPGEEESDLAANDWVGAFTADHRCVGALRWDEDGLILPAIGDDPETGDVVEGFEPGGSIYFRVIRSADNSEHLGRFVLEDVEGDNNRVYTVDGVSTLRVNAGWPVRPVHFGWQPAGENSHSFYILRPTIDDEPLEIGDEIAVLTPADMVVGSGTWIGHMQEEWLDSLRLGFSARADDPETGDEIEGFRVDEPFRFLIWDQSADTEFEVEISDHVQGPDTFQMGALTILSLNGISWVEQAIPLREGWGIISTNLDLVDRDIPTIFERDNVVDNLLMFKDQNGDFYLPDWGYNGIDFWHTEQGYQIKMVRADTLILCGYPVDIHRPIPIRENWNIIAYYPNQVLRADVAFRNIWPNQGLAPMDECQLLMVKNEDGEFCLPDWGYNPGLPMEPTKGYQVKVTESTDFVWNDEAQVAAVGTYPDIKCIPRRFVEPVPTGENMSLLFVDVNGVEEIGVFTANGLCVGATAFATGRNGNSAGEMRGIAVWGDDPTTERIDGAVAGDILQFRIWDGTTELAVNPDCIQGVPVYTTDDFAAISIANLEIPCQFSLTSIHPNPFNSTATIRYSIDRDALISIKIFDLKGRETAVLFDGHRQSGSHQLVFEAGNLVSGVYFCRIRDDAERQHIRKLLLVR